MLDNEKINDLCAEKSEELELLRELRSRRNTYPKASDIMPCAVCKFAVKALNDGVIPYECKACHPYLKVITDDITIEQNELIDMENMFFKYLGTCRSAGRFLLANNDWKQEYFKQLRGNPISLEYKGFALEAGI